MEFIYNNTKINYEIKGNGEKLVVFLHGWGAGSEMFLPLAKEIYKEGNSFLFIDFPPFGKSEEPKTVWTIQDYKAMTLQIIQHILDEQNYTSLDIISHSFGGRIAILLASENELKLNKLILIGAAGIKPKRGLIYKTKVLKYKIMKKIAPQKAANMGSEDYKKLSFTMKQTFKNIVSTDLTSLCDKISCQTLIIYGQKDKETPIYMAKKLHKSIKNPKLIIVKGAHHFVYLEQLNLVSKYVNLFLNTW